MGDGAVRVFISYSWDSKEHKKWVRKLSDDLNRAGIDTILDVKDMDVGDPIPEFMEKSISDSDFVLVVLTPNYKTKADKRLGGVGVEDSIIAADIYEKQNHRKYKTILAAGTWSTSTPTWARAKLGVDMSSEDVYEEGLERLIESCMRGQVKTKSETLTSEEYFDRGNKKLINRSYAGAISDFTKAIELDPDFATAYSNRGYAFNELVQYDKAIADCTKAIDLNPNHALAYGNRGYAFNETKQYSKAVADCTKAIEFDPSFASAYNNRGWAYNKLSKYDKAIADYTKAIEIDPNYATAYLNRANTYERIGEYAKAEADRAKAKEIESRE